MRFRSPDTGEALPMRKRRMSVEARRGQILEKASAIFAQYGLDGARTRYIADACGMNEATLYRYFLSKEDLFMQSMNHLHDKLAGGWWIDAAEARDGLEAVRQGIRARVRMMYERPEVCAIVLHGFAACTRVGQIRQMIHPYFMKDQNLTEEVLRKGIRDGSLRPDLDVQAAAWWLRSFTWFVSLVIVLGMQDYLSRERAYQILDEHLHGIARQYQPLAPDQSGPAGSGES
jgi:AcrR family transcriptional regulator